MTIKCYHKWLIVKHPWLKMASRREQTSENRAQKFYSFTLSAFFPFFFFFIRFPCSMTTFLPASTNNLQWLYLSNTGEAGQCKLWAVVMERQLTALLHIFTYPQHAWVSVNGLHAHGVKLLAVDIYNQLNKPVDKHITLPLRLCILIILS